MVAKKETSTAGVASDTAHRFACWLLRSAAGVAVGEQAHQGQVGLRGAKQNPAG